MPLGPGHRRARGQHAQLGAVSRPTPGLPGQRAAADIRSRVSVEAAATLGWHRFVGRDGIAIGIDRFGASAPGDVVMAHLGITLEAVVEAATSLVT